MPRIPMENDDVGQLSRSPHGEIVQQGGGGSIEMLGGSDLHMSHTPVSSVQKGGGSGTIDMSATPLELSHEPHHMYEQISPSDKGDS